MAKTGPVRVTVTVEAHPTTENHEIDRDRWNRMTPAERRAELDAIAEATLNNAGGYGWALEDPDDEADTED